MQANDEANALLNLIVDSPKVTGKYLFYLILEGSIISTLSILYCLETWRTSPFLSIVFTCPFFAILYIWLSVVMLGKMTQLPLRLLILNRIYLAHKGRPNRGELVRRLINIIQSRLWRVNHFVGKNNLSLLIIGTFFICFRGDRTENYEFEDTLNIETLLSSVFRLPPEHIELLLRSPPTPEQLSAIFSCSVAALTTLFLRLASSFVLFVIMFRQRGVPIDAEEATSDEKKPCSKFLEDKLRYWKWGEKKAREKKEKLMEQKRRLQAAIEQASEELRSKIKPVIDPVMRPLDRLQSSIKDSFQYAASSASISMAAIAEQHHAHLHSRLQREKERTSASSISESHTFQPITDPFEDFGFGPAAPIPTTTDTMEDRLKGTVPALAERPHDDEEIGSSLDEGTHVTVATTKSTFLAERDVTDTNTSTKTGMQIVDLDTGLEGGNVDVENVVPTGGIVSQSSGSGATATSTSTSVEDLSTEDASLEDQELRGCRTTVHTSKFDETDDGLIGSPSFGAREEASIDTTVDLPKDMPSGILEPCAEQLFTSELLASLGCTLTGCVTPDCVECESEEEEEEEDEDCPICLGPFEIGETVACLPCNSRHFFHADCIHPWLLQDKRCPLCATDIDWED